MPHQPSSHILFLSICSLTKAPGGSPDYDPGEALVAQLKPDLAGQLLKRREEARRLVRKAKDLDWQGVTLSELAFNEGLTGGPDFGGKLQGGAYLPALQRYEGRFFQTLGPERADRLAVSNHHTLFLSGLYGLLRPWESIQLYSCPVKPQVADLWNKADLLTKVLADYINSHSIVRLFDLTALSAYRNLIDWEQLTQLTGVDSLHCFYKMGAGDYALIPFGKLVNDYLLTAPEDELIDLQPEASKQGVIFRSLRTTEPGWPEELLGLRRAEREVPLLAGYGIEHLDEVLAGGMPLPSSSSPYHADIRSDEWLFALSGEFRKSIDKVDGKMRGKVLNAIAKICRAPMHPQGDTIKPLTGRLAGWWRYRIDTYRLVYIPDSKKKTVFLLYFDGRGNVYEALER